MRRSPGWWRLHGERGLDHPVRSRMGHWEQGEGGVEDPDGGWEGPTLRKLSDCVPSCGVPEVFSAFQRCLCVFF